MKKMISLLTAVSALTLCSAVYAEEGIEQETELTQYQGTGPAAIAVTGTYSEYENGETIVSVDVAWDAMNFQYVVKEQGRWDPESHSYGEDITESRWLSDTRTITVTNHSNAEVTAGLGFEAAVDGLYGSFTGADVTENVLTLATAEETAVAEAPEASAEFGVSGAAIAADQKIGTITVSLEAQKPEEIKCLDLSGKETSEYNDLIAAYLAENGTDLTVKLGTSVLSQDTQRAINSAVYEYYNSYDNKVDLTVLDATEIAEKAFQYSGFAFRSVSFPNVVKIGENAFNSSGSFQSGYFPKVTSIGAYAFQFCGSLTSLTFETTMTYLGNRWLGSGDGSYDNIYGTETNAANITLTVSKDQGLYENGSAIYQTVIGVGGQFGSYTFLEVKRAA